MIASISRCVVAEATLRSSCAAWNRLRENPARREALPLGGGQLADAVVEAGDLHPAGAGVVALGDQRGQLADRVAGGAAGGARVHVLGAGLRGCTVKPISPRRP